MLECHNTRLGFDGDPKLVVGFSSGKKAHTEKKEIFDVFDFF